MKSRDGIGVEALGPQLIGKDDAEPRRLRQPELAIDKSQRLSERDLRARIGLKACGTSTISPAGLHATATAFAIRPGPLPQV